MKLYALYWEDMSPEETKEIYKCFCRRDIISNERLITVIYAEGQRRWTHSFTPSRSQKRYSLKETMNIADKYLIQLNYILLDEEESKKYLVLK